MNSKTCATDAAAETDACEERKAQRYTLLIRAAKLVCTQGEFVCVIRDVSDTGVSLRTFHAIPDCEPLVLELQTGESYTLSKVWQRGNEAGFTFEASVDVDAFVAEVGQYPKRQLRLPLSFPVELDIGTQRINGELHNLSQQGARITCPLRLAIAQPVRLVTNALPEVRARVRWRSEDEFGIAFDDTFTLRDLALIAARIQCPALLAEPDCAASLRS